MRTLLIVLNLLSLAAQASETICGTEPAGTGVSYADSRRQALAQAREGCEFIQRGRKTVRESGWTDSHFDASDCDRDPADPSQCQPGSIMRPELFESCARFDCR